MNGAIVGKHEGVPAYVSANVEDILARLHEVREVLAHPAIPLLAAAKTRSNVLVILDDAYGEIPHWDLIRFKHSIQ
jgi:hypothetical protein